jgi:hypothetical protein
MIATKISLTTINLINRLQLLTGFVLQDERSVRRLLKVE